MQAIPATRIPRSDLPSGVLSIDPTLIDHVQWKGRRVEIVGTTDDSRLVTELDDEND
jgi:hypothetical protein